ncbi:hypothetical protein EGT36_01985 [Agrobacterium sp. FDAARGOS_525]|uniref:hypothetical protein n=1 Tax=Agrobacterium sp. FDAARGOS_525 TaxID=2420311 RepID=UPI000F662755|nr:hypothetical protein [Agrobacterium sp. FDAARGOS_525]RSC36191.1 hypothetical protein EGT36_01985 [Agrobacterium sp. FDAARGOS_525]
MTTLILKKTSLKSASPGSLLRYDMEGRSSYAIVIETEVNFIKAVVIGLNHDMFALGNLTRDEDAYDLGMEWFLEPVDVSKPYVKGDEASKEIGLLKFDEKGEPLLSVTDVKHYGEPVYWNLKSRKQASAASIVPLAIGDWKLWANHDERNSVNGKPLFTKIRKTADDQPAS